MYDKALHFGAGPLFMCHRLAIYKTTRTRVVLYNFMFSFECRELPCLLFLLRFPTLLT
jgi:hypothetical protein